MTNVEEARRLVDLYRMRWVIEEFFRTLKTAGFDIEETDIGEPLRRRCHDGGGHGDAARASS